MALVDKRAGEIKQRSQELTDCVRELRNVGSELTLLKTAGSATNLASKVHWLRRAADTAGAALESLSACRKGCSHCCAIPVMVAENEARIIGRQIGRRPAKVTTSTTFANALEQPGIVEEAQHAMAAKYTGVECTFLRDGECSIYEHRPLACRGQINIDRDALMCELVEGFGVPVVYLDMTPHKVMYLQVLGLRQQYADLRDWFPD